MHLIRVTDQSIANEFLNLPARLYQEHRGWVRSQQKHVKKLLHQKEKLLSSGQMECWILSNFRGQTIGRVMALADYSFDQPRGYFALFECVDHQKAAKLLLEEASRWLQQFGITQMSGPISFLPFFLGGLSDDSLVQTPHLLLGYHAAYYTDFFKDSGFNKKAYQHLLHFENLSYALTGYKNPLPEKDFDWRMLEKRSLKSSLVEIQDIIHASSAEAPRFSEEEIYTWLKQMYDASYTPMVCLAYQNSILQGFSVSAMVPSMMNVQHHRAKFPFLARFSSRTRSLINLCTYVRAGMEHVLSRRDFMFFLEQYMSQPNRPQYDAFLMLDDESLQHMAGNGESYIMNTYYKFIYRFDQQPLIGTFAKNNMEVQDDRANL